MQAIIAKDAYRGQHGKKGQDLIQTRLPSISFGTKEVATEYALDPNCPHDTVINPQLIRADLRIEKPLPLSEDDPFMDASVILEVMGEEEGRALLAKLDEHIYNTGNWHENFADRFSSVSDVIAQAPERLHELYLDAYVVLDTLSFVAAAIAKGFDGAAHGGNGVSALTTEYRVFSESQISVVEVVSLDDDEELDDIEIEIAA